jgi:hypothetical protein
MNKWKPGDLPRSIDEYGFNHQIWTDADLAKFCVLSLVIGFILGWVI